MFYTYLIDFEVKQDPKIPKLLVPNGINDMPHHPRQSISLFILLKM